ncbi:MAG: coproporphyrinogen-III oxidase family protein [Rhizomicrobium sp.]
MQGAISTVAEMREHIRSRRGRRQSNKVLHAHPSPLFWRDPEAPVVDIINNPAVSGGGPVSLYVATPYCLPTNPTRCGFCLFPSEDYHRSSQLDEYLHYLSLECDLYRPHVGSLPVTSVYFGGGTANLYRDGVYRQLCDVVRKLFPLLSADAEITLEGIPQLFNDRKLRAMKDAGINRVSIGVQQLQDRLIKFSGRNQTADQVYRTLAWCAENDVVTSVDLIFGWPTQTLEDMLGDLEILVDLGVRHITHYELNVAGRSDFARTHRDSLPSIEDNLQMYRAGRDFLLSRGFRQATPYDFEKRDPSSPRQGTYAYEEATRNFTYDGAEQKRVPQMLGLGFAAVSIFPGSARDPGAAYMNPTTVADYAKALEAGRFPANRFFAYSEKDRHLLAIFQSLQSMRIDRRGYRAVFGEDVYEEFSLVWEALREEGWLSATEDFLETIGDGVFFTPLIQAILAQERVKEIQQQSSGKPARPMVQLRVQPTST